MNASENNLLPCVEITPSIVPTASVIWLHGLGADGHDFIPIVKELNLPKDLAIRFVFPHAKARSITINNGYVMRAWYDIRGFDFKREGDLAGIVDSAKEIEKLIVREHERGIAYHRIILAGFSQGGAMALYTGLRYPQRLAGLLALSAYLLKAQTLTEGRQSSNEKTPIFIAHGQQDSLVPCVLGEQAADLLRSLNYDVTFKTYPVEHSVCLEEIQAIAVWLQQAFK